MKSNQSGIAVQTVLLTVLVLAIGGAIVLASLQELAPPTDTVFPSNPQLSAQPVPVFESCSEITAAFEKAQENQSKRYGYGFGLDVMRTTAVGAPTAAQSESASDSSAPGYSTTNVQVQGVDEADIVKTDGEFIYTLSDGLLVIARAFPVSDAQVVSKISLNDISPTELFLQGHFVLVFGQDWREINPRPLPIEPQTGTGASKIVAPDYYPHNSGTTVIQVWNVSDKQNPQLVKTAEFEGQYVSSRKIGNQVFFVLTSYPNYWALQQGGSTSAEELIPVYREKEGSFSSTDSFEPVAPCGQVGYLEPIQAQNFIVLGSLDMTNPDAPIQKQTVLGSGQNVYASEKNLYVAEVSYPWPEPTPIESVNDAVRSFVPAREETVVHTFSLENNSIAYLGSMQAPGHILNQFSMDEFDGYFRIATTIGNLWDSQNSSTNNVFVFGPDLKQTGAVEGLAPGEKIYSARFMGKKGYLVTFKKVDPLFVIDLTDPYNPRVLGKLKIPGYSDYLHPLDETHLIGIGKDAIDAEQSLVDQRGLDFAWYQGLKLAIFDVSDVANPRQLHQVIIGDRGTESLALHDHKAFLFDREKNLLVLPITLAQISAAQKESQPNPGQFPAYGEFTFQGAYVFDVTIENGFVQRGRITHDDSGQDTLRAGYYYGSNSAIQRSLFIGNVLYTISNQKIKLNDLTDLSEIKQIQIGSGNEPYLN